MRNRKLLMRYFTLFFLFLLSSKSGVCIYSYNTSQSGLATLQVLIVTCGWGLHPPSQWGVLLSAPSTPICMSSAQLHYWFEIMFQVSEVSTSLTPSSCLWSGFFLCLHLALPVPLIGNSRKRILKFKNMRKASRGAVIYDNPHKMSFIWVSKPWWPACFQGL